jgi:hypothetical protein
VYSVAQTRPNRGAALRVAMIASFCSLLCGQNSSPSLDGAAKLLTFTGQISVLRGDTPWALNVGDVVQPQEVIVTGPDGYGVFQVADGSKFEVFPQSRVVFRANRGDWRDLLDLWLGKVRVQIEHFGGQPNHNTVRTPSAVISVRGTVFDVEVEDTTDTTLVIDEEGQVEVRHLLQPGQTKVLNPGEFVRVYKNEPLARKMIDNGTFLERAARAASDALYQAAINASHAGNGVPTGSQSPGSPGDHKQPVPPPPTVPPRN